MSGKNMALYFSVMVMWTLGLIGCIYLVMHDHPYIGVFVLIVFASIQLKQAKIPKDEEDEDEQR